MASNYEHAHDDVERPICSGDDVAETGAVAEPAPSSRLARLLGLGVAAAAAVGLVGVTELRHPGTLVSVVPKRFTGLEEQSYQTMQAAKFVPAYGYTGTLKITGLVKIFEADKPQQHFVWTLRGTDAGCTSDADSPGVQCGMAITQGTSCGSPILADYYSGTTNPYPNIHYKSTDNFGVETSFGRAQNIAIGYTGKQILGKAFIVYDQNGLPAACSPVERSMLSDLPGGACFPGGSVAQVRGRGEVAVEELRAGDEVLVRKASGALEHEPLLGFLHATAGASKYLTVTHAGGELQASANHLVFVKSGETRLVSELRAGDELLVASEDATEASVVLGVRSDEGEEGMFAPLTWSGSIVVNGAVASAYATHSPSVHIPHGALHALFFPARFLAAITGGVFGAGPAPRHADTVDEKHGLADFYSRLLIPFAKNVLSL
eukprot:TRINITY_DN2714_c0_g4_i1.p1 TRINITY_DN2714_c0_g4~~TRINITY_DN2714_c0_g4_i1.p1  ORF type:complete len:453 (+),score=110.71 TRINITY_DN2714_c0_g4_i1:58-1359(+)